MAHRRRIGDGSSGPTTFLAPSTRIIGTIVGEGPYVFCGSVEGECDVDGSVTLAEGGRWHGTIRATDVVVAGEVDGDVIARNRVEIASTGRVSGSLEGHAIAVAVGAVIEGEINIASGGEPTRFEEKRGR
jgi:cytoskeletal protein CcmA (bactofilin family)